MIFRKPVFQLWPEVPDKTLNWPGSAVSQSADGVALNLFAQFPNHINLLWPEVPDKTLNWPGSAVSQSADGVALNLFAQFPNHINLLWLRVAFSEPPHHCV